MGKKKVTYDLNDKDKPLNHDTNDHHHHHRHHRHHNHQKPKKIKSEAKLLHTLNSHFKKLAKCRSRKKISYSSPRTINVSHDYNKHHHGHVSSWFKVDDKDDRYDWFMGYGFDVHCDEGGYVGVFEFGLEKMSFLDYENNEDLFGWECMFAPDLNASHNIRVVFEEDGHGYGYEYGSYIPDLVMNSDNGDGGKYIYDVLELSSEEDMINEFLRVNFSFLD